MFSQEIVPRLRQAGFRLIVIGLAAYPLGGAQANLIKHALVIVQVVFRQFYHLLTHQHIKITLNSLQGGAFAGIQHGPGARVYRCFLTRDFAGSRKAIKDVLHKVNSRFAAVQVTQMLARRAGRGIVGLFPAATGGEIQRRQIAAFGGAKILFSGVSTVCRGVNLWVP